MIDTSSSLTSEQLQALTKICSSRPPSRFSPPAFVRDLAVVGYSHGLTDQQILIFARKQVATREGLKTFLGQHTPRKRVLAAAKRCALNSSPTAAPKNAQRVARLLAGRLLSKIEKGTPQKGNEVDDDLDDEAWAAAILDAPKADKTPVSPATQLRARVALAVVGVDLLESINSENGWSTIQMSYSRTSLLTAWSATTSKRALNDLVQMSLISELPTARKATARRFKLNRGLTLGQREVAAGQYETIGALMGREGASSLTGGLIKAVTHSAWNYGPSALTHRAWWTAVCDSAGIDPATLGVSKRNVSLDRKALLAAGLVDLKTSAELTAALDAYSRESGALEAKREAEEAYRIAASARTAEVKFHQGLKGDAKRIVEELGGSFAATPKIHVYGGRKFARWIETTTEALADREYPVELAAAVQAEMSRGIGGRMRDANAGKIVAGWMTSKLVVEQLPARRITAMTAARGLEHFGAAHMNIPASTADEITQRVWLKELQEKLTGLPAMTEEMKAAIAGDLRARLLLRGYDEDRSTKASSWCLRGVALVQAPVAIAA